MKSAIPENLREFSIFVLFLLVVTYLVGISALITWVSVAYQNFSTGVDAVQQVRILQVGSVAIFAAIGLPFAAYRTFIADQEKEISRDEAEVSKRKQANEVILTASKLMADEIDGHMRKFRVSAGMLTMMKEANVELSYHNHVLGILAAGVPNRDEHSDTPQARFYFESLSEALALRTSKQSDFEIEQQHQIDLSRKSIRDFNLKRIPPLFSLVLDQSKVSDCLWEDLVISKMNATGSKIESCQFERLKINRLDLSGGADISNTKFFDCKFKWASFEVANFLVDPTKQTQLFNKCTFQDVDFSGANLSGHDFENSKIENGVFINGFCNGTKFGRTVFSGDTTFLGTEVYECDFSRSTGLKQDMIAGAQGDETTKLPNGMEYPW